MNYRRGQRTGLLKASFSYKNGARDIRVTVAGKDPTTEISVSDSESATNSRAILLTHDAPHYLAGFLMRAAGVVDLKRTAESGQEVHRLLPHAFNQEIRPVAC